MTSPHQNDCRPTADALLRSGRVEEAVAEYERALARDATNAAAWFNLGNAQAVLGRHASASASFGRVISLCPNSAAAYFNKGNADQARGELLLAAQSFQEAVRIDPQAGCFNNLGTTLALLGRTERAVDALREAVQRDPSLEAAHVNLCQGLLDLGHRKAVVRACHAALELHPRSERILKILGRCWQRSGVLSNAIACLQQAVQIKPNDGDLHLTLGNLSSAAGQLSSAEYHLQSALHLGADKTAAHNNLGEVYRKRGHLQKAIDHQRAALRLNPDLAVTHSNLLLTMLYDPEVSGAELLREAQAWALRHAAAVSTLPPRPPGHRDRLRIGYVSGGFHNHPVGIFLEPVLRGHDRNRFEVHCYAHQETWDDRTQRLRAAADSRTDIADDPDEALAGRIWQDGVDILVDLSGHTKPSRLLAFAHKPAPIQVTWIGYAATTGLKAVDYILADPWVVPEAEESYYVERVERLPGHYVCFDAPRQEVPQSRRPSPDRRLTFGCFNNNAKLNSHVIDIWSGILREIPESRLFLKTPSLGDEEVQRELLTGFAKRGVTKERIHLEGHSSRDELLAAYQEVDLCLDPFPFNGGVTTLEALSMGVPVLNLLGHRFVGHTGESFLRAVGLESLVVPSAEAYHKRACELARDTLQLRQLRTGLRERLLASPLCDEAAFTRQLEEAYWRMWRRHCDQWTATA